MNIQTPSATPQPTRAAHASVLMPLAIVLLLATGAIHAWDARDAFHDMPYKGVLFGLNALGALVASAGIARRAAWGWMLGALVAGGALAAYVASRTVGLPGLPAEPDAWLEPLGVASLLAEAGFLLVAWLHRNATRSGFTGFAASKQREGDKDGG